MLGRLVEILNIVFIDLLRKNKILRGAFLVVAVGLSGASLALAYAATVGHVFVGGRELKLIDTLPVLLTSLFIVFWLLVSVAVSAIDPERLKEVLSSKDEDHFVSVFAESVLDPIAATIRIGRSVAEVRRAHKEEVIGPPTQEAQEQTVVEEDIITGIRGNLGHLIEYYKMNKSQARNSFNASLYSIIAGFVTLVIGGIWAYTAERNDLTAYLVPFAGVILQFIGGGYFYLYNRSLIQLNFFFSRLAQMQDTLLAIHLTETIPDGDDKNRALERLIFVVAERSTTAPAYLSQEDLKKKAS
ncbi:TRADD-N-associated membrane domain-containing protein [Rhizobium sp. SYY.PMSO]|uniref:TRADD-N-associated membrane domain-containing protein n=1 Tax=Rhizobium sp. SYY.PMSO TaxID=3382192 RepID=UPI003990270E